MVEVCIIYETIYSIFSSWASFKLSQNLEVGGFKRKDNDIFSHNPSHVILPFLYGPSFPDLVQEELEALESPLCTIYFPCHCDIRQGLISDLWLVSDYLSVCNNTDYSYKVLLKPHQKYMNIIWHI